jgi:hypothetical protein
MTKRVALSVVVVVIAVIVGWAAGTLVMRAIPGVQVQPGFVELTPAHVLAFEATFVVVTIVSALLGLRFVWRRR